MAIDTQTLNDAAGDYAVTILAVRPHPDDETSLTGGMLAHYSARGVSTAVVTCTGEEGEIHDPDLDPVADCRACARSASASFGMPAPSSAWARSACSATATRGCLIRRESAPGGVPPGRSGRGSRSIGEGHPRASAPRHGHRPPGGLYPHPDHVRCHTVGFDAYYAAADYGAYPEAGPAWKVARLYAGVQIDDGRWEELMPEFKEAGLDVSWMERRQERPRAPGPETATVALDVSPYSEIQRQALLAHGPRSRGIASGSRCRKTCAARPSRPRTFCASIRRPCRASQHDLLDGLDITNGTAIIEVQERHGDRRRPLQ